MNLLEVGLQAMRRKLSFEARAYQKKKKKQIQILRILQVLRAITSLLKIAPTMNPITSKTRLACIV